MRQGARVTPPDPTFIEASRQFVETLFPTQKGRVVGDSTNVVTIKLAVLDRDAQDIAPYIYVCMYAGM